MTSNDDDDLAGFRDFIDGDNPPKKAPKKRRESTSNSFELMTFLENESLRLDSHNKFYEEKVYMLNNFPQSKAIKHNLENEVENNITVLERMLIKKDSSLFKSLNQILNQFKK